MQSKTLTKLFSNSSQKFLHNKGWLVARDKSYTQKTLIQNLDPDVMFFSSSNLFQTLIRRAYLKANITTVFNFTTTTKQKQLHNETVSNKLVPQEIFLQGPTKFFTQRAEEQTVEIAEIGWAGQPIVKRLHPILPEVHGDISDIIKGAKKSKAISEIGNNLEVQVKHFGRSHDIISVINENAQGKMNETVPETRPRRLHTKKSKMFYQPSIIVKKKSKRLKRRKKTIIMPPKPANIQNSVKIKKYKKKKPKTKKILVINKKTKIQPNTVLTRHLSSEPLSRYFFHIDNRQFRTFSACNAQKAAVAVKYEKKVSALSVTGKSKKAKASSKESLNINPADDCVCPEILYTVGKRKTTKICGEAAGKADEKKRSSWKQKMCLVEPKEDPGRKRTLVCISEAAKQQKRKRDLPKCPEPEIKVAPRVVICEPNLEEEEAKKSKKECIKIEEVKIRKRTKVCKPVIIFAKEEAEVKVEKKAVCLTSRVKKVVSRHTKICPPAEKK